MKITITRALTELKTLDKRIQKNIDSGVFVSFHGKFHQPNPRSKLAVADLQSIHDLLERRKKLKSLIVMSNATTKVVICEKEMTVAEAIETKSSIKHYDNLLNRLKAQYAEANRKVENLNERVRSDLERKTKLSGENELKMDLIKFSKDYMAMHGIVLFDPVNIARKIKELEDYITQFKAEVDFVLTEKNSTTFIEL